MPVLLNPMLTVPQIESLRTSNPQLYEALKRLAEASLGPNQGWSLDDQITDGSLFARVTSGALTSGKVDPAKSGVLMKGSVPPTWSGAFTYVSTTTTITWSWTGLTISRADGTTTAIPNGSLAISGLTAATTYYFYPYYDDAALAIGWVAGGASSAGSPANAFTAKTNAAAQQQALQSRIPLSQGAVVAATTSSGTGGGSGGGSGSCVRAGTMVLTKERGTVAIETCAVGEHLRCPSILRADATTAATSASSNAAAAMGGTAEGWTRIIRHEVRERGHVHPPAFLQRRNARRHSAPHLHSRRRFAHARRAPLPQRYSRRPLRPRHPAAHRNHHRSRPESNDQLRPIPAILRRPPRRLSADAQLHLQLVSLVSVA